MGRRIDASHEADVIARWRATLAPVIDEVMRPGRSPGRARVRRRLIECLKPGLDRETNDAGPPQLQDAVATLLAAAALDDTNQRREAVDQWIVHTLIRKGRRLLVSEARRTAMLVRARDADRRAGRRKKNLVSNLVSMPREDWVRLRQAGRTLGLRSPADIIPGLVDRLSPLSAPNAPTTPRRPASSVKPAATAQGSLDLETENGASEAGMRERVGGKGSRMPRDPRNRSRTP